MKCRQPITLILFSFLSVWILPQSVLADAPGEELTDISASQIQMDLKWCFGAAVAQNRVHRDILDDVSQLPKEYVAFVQTMIAATPTPEQLYLAQKVTALMTEPVGSDDLKKMKEKGGEFWASPPTDPLERISFYSEHSGPFGLERLDCGLRFGQAMSKISETRTDKFTDILTVSEALYDKVEPKVRDKFDVEAAKGLVSLFLEDGKLERAETQILKAVVVRGDVTLSDGVRSRQIRASDVNVRQLISFFTGPVDMTDLWLTTPALTATLANVSQIKPETNNMIANFIARQMLPIVQDSRLSDGYAPIKAALSEIKNMSMRIEDTENAKQVRRLTFLAMRKIDVASGDQVPDSLYVEFQNN